jgi:uncharacterized protein (TIGR02996 family)
MAKQTDKQAAFLKAICDNPEDDAVRLVYADWLDDQAQSLPGSSEQAASMAARAEFIRLQVAEAAKPQVPWQHRPLTAREEELFKKWNTLTGWRSEVPERRGLFIDTWYYERGFPYRLIASSVRSFLKAAPEVFSRAPITQVSFRETTQKAAAELARSPELARIRCLYQNDTGWQDSILPAFADTPHLCNLQKLILGDHRVTASGLRPFLANPSLTRLTSIRTPNGGRVGSGIVTALVASAAAPVLEHICLQQNGLPAEEAVHLPALARLPRLRELNLNGNALGDEGAESLAGTAVSTAVHIHMGWNRITDRGGEAFLAGPLLRSPGVRVSLLNNELSEGMQAKLRKKFGDRVDLW